MMVSKHLLLVVEVGVRAEVCANGVEAWRVSPRNSGGVSAATGEALVLRGSANNVAPQGAEFN